MNLQDKIEFEMKILMGLIERYKQSEDPSASTIIVAYEYGLQVLMTVYEASKQEEVKPF
ncbi:hypothetical protein [Bacillus toyonensis]|uniref:hypothetical protein n=1 Tax=Bacillus toyonensis TaxID=155322 RepID=UPI00159B9939|nr:hypothetical protein [Bacillus toyonensis]